jgi:hypothetical protein
MSRRRTDKRVPLDGLTGEQLAIVRHGTFMWLMGMASDLGLLERGMEKPKRHLKRTQALGRLAIALEREMVDLPDPLLEKMLTRRTTETIHLDELKEEYEKELAEHEAWAALLAHFSGSRGTSDG